MPKSAGRHIILDARVKDSSVFTRSSLTALFAHIVKSLNMTALGEPIIYEVDVDPAVLAKVEETGVFADEGGITATQVISTSHLALHAWPLQNFFSLDIFSCKEFDWELTLDIIRTTLGVVDEETMVLDRFKPDPGYKNIDWISAGQFDPCLGVGGG